MSVIQLWNLDSQKKVLLEKAIAPHCSYKKRAQYFDEAEKIQVEIFKCWREGIVRQVEQAISFLHE